MRYFLCLLMLVLSGCLNVPFVPLIDNNTEEQSPVNAFVGDGHSTQIFNNEASRK
ncbi:MAG: hypothetical protein ACI8XI_000766 [Woeseiaceae bacterium]|jgi:hypothetical protein